MNKIMKSAAFMTFLPLASLAQETAEPMEVVVQPAGAALGVIPLLIMLVVTLFFTACWWVILSKRGLPGWGILIPIYNMILVCKAADKPAWWFLLLFIPGVNIVIIVLIALGLAAQFGRGAGFGIGLWLLPVVFLPLLAFTGGGSEPAGIPQLPTSAEGEDAPVMPAAGTASSAEIKIFGTLAILAGLCFMVLVAFQVVEYMHYAADPSIWP